MRYKAVLFDMDGTVLDTLADLHDSVNAALAHFGLPGTDADAVRRGLGNGAAHLIASVLPQGTDEALSAELLAWYKAYYDGHCRVKTAPYSGIVPLLERLRREGVKLAIVSNKPDGAVRELAAAFFPGLLETAVGESALVRRKPCPDTVLAAMEAMGLERADCVYVGDSEVDVATAKNAGMDCISVTWGFRGEKELIEAGAVKLARAPEDIFTLLL